MTVMTHRERTLDDLTPHLESLPIFPLEQAVLFPHATLPLHIFETRYRELVRDARDQDLPIAIAMVRPGISDTLGRPTVHRVAGAGFLEGIEELHDGRFLIELVGVARVELVHEHPPEQAYRRVVANLLREPDARLDADPLETLRLLLVALQSSHPQAARSLIRLIEGQRHPGVVADLLASAVIADAQRRQSLLEQVDPVQRLESITHHLGEVLARLTRSQHARDLN